MTELKQNPYYYEKDPEKKGSEWGSKMISALRAEWKHIVEDIRESNDNMNYLLSKQDLDSIKNGFSKGKKFQENTNWVPVAVYERLRQILCAEFMKGAYKPHVEATDLASSIQKKKELIMLRNRSLIEGPMTDLNRRIGNPAYKLSPDKFQSNVEEFDQLGLDSNNDGDVQRFGNEIQRLWHETTAESITRALMESNEFENDIEKLVNDILGRGKVCYQVYASPYTGEIKWKYLDPVDVKAIKGDRRDYKDAMCMGFEKRVTVRQFVEWAGPDFSFETNGDDLKNAVNVSNGTAYVFINKEGCYAQGEKGIYLAASFGQLMGHMVDMGYIEWKSIDGKAKKKNSKNGFLYDISYSEDLSKSTTYTKEVMEWENTYQSWYLSTGLNTQKTFRYGPLYHVLTHGAHYEYSSYSISAMSITGKSAVELTKGIVDVVNTAFYKILWGIQESTPRKRIYNYDALVQLTSKLKPKTSGSPDGEKQVGVTGMINEILDKYTNSLYELYTIPKIDGQAFGGNQRLNYWDEGGLDPIAVAMTTVLDWAEMRVEKMLGIGAQIDTDKPDPKDGFRVKEQNIRASKNSTYYVPFMIMNTMKNVCITSLNIAQDAIKHKTQVYTFIERLIGIEEMQTLKGLADVPLHEYGAYVKLFNSDEKKEQQRQEAFLAFQKGEITYEDYLIIKELDDYKRAGIHLMVSKRRAAMEKEKQDAIAHERLVQMQREKYQGEIGLINAKGELELRREEIRGEYYMRAHQTPADAAITKKQMDIDTNAQKQDEHAQAQLAIERGKKSIQAETPLPAAVAPESVQSPVSELV